MEMHQIRYFLAVSNTLNFTRAAEECNVAQPSLTRAIKKLEEELGGELFRRERRRTHMTDLGGMMLPLLTQSYESALAAKELAGSYRKGDNAPLCLALTRTVDLHLLVGPLAELVRAFPGLELKFFRGNAIEVAEHLKRGDSELAVGGPLGDTWERLESWPLFTEGFRLVVHKDHALARQNRVTFPELAGEKILARPYCEQAEEMTGLLERNGVAEASGHRLASEHDLIALLEANVGVGFMPASAKTPDTLRSIEIEDLELSRTVHLYA
ncbi:MAG: LysR family transcriptional regulator, partial [Hyphomicrobiaceae bacterium]